MPKSRNNVLYRSIHIYCAADSAKIPYILRQCVWTTSAYHSKHFTGKYQDTGEHQVDQERTGGAWSAKTYERWGSPVRKQRWQLLTDTDVVGVWPNVSSFIRAESRFKVYSCMWSSHWKDIMIGWSVVWMHCAMSLKSSDCSSSSRWHSCFGGVTCFKFKTCRWADLWDKRQCRKGRANPGSQWHQQSETTAIVMSRSKLIRKFLLQFSFLHGCHGTAFLRSTDRIFVHFSGYMLRWASCWAWCCFRQGSDIEVAAVDRHCRADRCRHGVPWISELHTSWPRRTQHSCWWGKHSEDSRLRSRSSHQGTHYELISLLVMLDCRWVRVPGCQKLQIQLQL